MGKFVFQLEAVLKQRRAVERERTLAVAALERERLAAEARLRAMQLGIAREREDLRERLMPTVGAQRGAGGMGDGGDATLLDVRGVRFQATAAVRLDALARQIALQLAGVYAKLEKARADLARAMGERKAVEKLREVRLEEWRLEQRRRDGAALDELATMRAARGRDDDGADGDAARALLAIESEDA